MSGSCEREKSQFWDYALTVNLHDVVYIHCHQHGKITSQQSTLFKILSHRFFNIEVFCAVVEHGLLLSLS